MILVHELIFSCRAVRILCQTKGLTLQQLHVELTTAPPAPSFSHLPFSGSAEELRTILKDFPDIFYIQKLANRQKVSLNRVKHELTCELLGLATNITISRTNRYLHYFSIFYLQNYISIRWKHLRNQHSIQENQIF
jgi:hypothetical protein